MKFSKLVIGSAQFGINYGIANKDGRVPFKDVEKILSYAYENGINNIDTALSYGISEKVICKYLNKNKDHKWVITSKISGIASSLESELKTSMERLERVPDIVLIHSVKDFFSGKNFDLFFEIKEKYKVKKIGASVYSVKEIKELLSINHHFDILQCPLNLLDNRLYDSGIIEEIKYRNIDVYARSVFLQGLFFLPLDKINNYFNDAYEELKKIKSIAAENNLTISEIALLWVFSKKEIDKIIIGVNKLSHLIHHHKTLTKELGSGIINKISNISFSNERVLNPSLWKFKNL